MKKIISIAVIIFYSMTTFVFASSQDPIYASLDQIILSEDNSKEFNKKVADTTSDKDMVVESYKKNNLKNKESQNINKNDIKAAENIKIHAFKFMSQSEFYKEYEANNDLDSFIDINNAIISTYRDKNLNYISSILFEKNTNDSADENINWRSSCGGELILSTETIQFLSDKNKVKNLLANLGIKKPEDMKVVVGISGIDAAIYLKENQNQIIIPLSDGLKYEGEDIEVCKGFTAYLARDFFSARKESDLKIENLCKKMYEDPNEEIVYGAEPSIHYENLKTLNLLANNKSESNDLKNTYIYLLIAVGVITVGAVLHRKLRS